MGRREHARAMASSNRSGAQHLSGTDTPVDGRGDNYQSSTKPRSQSPTHTNKLFVRHGSQSQPSQHKTHHISPISFVTKMPTTADNTVCTLSRHHCSDSSVAKSLLLLFISLFICVLLAAFGTSSFVGATPSTTPPAPVISSSSSSSSGDSPPPLEQIHINRHQAPHYRQRHHHNHLHQHLTNTLASQNQLVRPTAASHHHLHRRSRHHQQHHQPEHHPMVHHNRRASSLDNGEAIERDDSDWLLQHSSSAQSRISEYDLSDDSLVRHNNHINNNINNELDRTRSHQLPVRNTHIKHHSRHREMLMSEDQDNNNVDDSHPRSKWRPHLRPTFNLHKYLHHKTQRESNKIHFSELDPISIGQQRVLHEAGSETKTNIHNNNNNNNDDDDDDRADDDDDHPESSPASTSTSTSTSPSFVQGQEDLEAASQDKVPERLPIVVSYSDNSYVSASPITKDSGVSQIGRLKTVTSTTQQPSTSIDSSNHLIDFRQISDLEPVATATTTTSTTSATEAASTAPTTTATTTAGLIPLSEDLEENRINSRGISKTNYLSKFTKEAQMLSDFSEGFDFEDKDVDDDGEQSAESSKTAKGLDNLQSTATSTSVIGLNDNAIQSNNNQIFEERIKFDINEQYHNRPATIIKTRESIEKGATFIKYTIVTNLDACLVECWITESCDTAVYQESPVDFNINNYNNKIINNPSPSVTSAESTTIQTASDFVTISANKHHEEIHQLISSPYSSSITPSTTLYKSNNYAIESDSNNSNNIVYSETKPFNDSKGNISIDSRGNQIVAGDTDEHRVIGVTNENRPVIFASSANNDADNYVRDTNNEIEHKRRWFKKDGSDKSHHQSIYPDQVNMNNHAEHGFYICYLFECVKKEDFKCEFSPHNFYTSSTKQQALSNNRRYSSLIRSPANSLYDRDNFDQSTKWPRIHRASIDIGEEDIRKFEQGGLNSAIIAIMFGVGATSMLIFIVGHKMKSIRRRVAYEVRRRSIVPDKDFLINTLTE